MAAERTASFDFQTFLDSVGIGKTVLPFPKKKVIFSQGDAERPACGLSQIDT